MFSGEHSNGAGKVGSHRIAKQHPQLDTIWYRTVVVQYVHEDYSCALIWLAISLLSSSFWLIPFAVFRNRNFVLPL